MKAITQKVTEAICPTRDGSSIGLRNKEKEVPTNDYEARQIFGIINEFIDVDTARKIVTRLHEQVGKHTENESLAVSLEMLAAAYSQEETVE